MEEKGKQRNATEKSKNPRQEHSRVSMELMEGPPAPC